MGIGDPDFKGTPNPSAKLTSNQLINARGAVDLKEIEFLPRLPDAADEIRDVANVLGASKSRLLLGADATERQVRSRALNEYKVISFATHAVVSGEIDGLSEPALVLSPGNDPDNSKNDGLLTASEVADLVLDANLVILSACNTAAPDGTVAGRGLSGLADAFFFAGVRAIAVTQWSVFSDAARVIGSGLVSRSVPPGTIGVSESLRRTMLNYIDTASEDYLAILDFGRAT